MTVNQNESLQIKKEEGLCSRVIVCPLILSFNYVKDSRKLNIKKTNCAIEKKL